MKQAYEFVILAGIVGGPDNALRSEPLSKSVIFRRQSRWRVRARGAYTSGIALQPAVVRFDGGQVSGYLRVNVPGPTPTHRLVVSIWFTGTTTVADDATGIANLRVVYPDQSLHVATLDMLIPDVRDDKGSKVAKRCRKYAA